VLIPESSKLEGTNQRKYIIVERTINIDGDKSDWAGIPAAFSALRNNNIPNPGTNIKGVYLSKDQTYLYVLMTLYGPPLVDNSTIYVLQARLLPEDDSFSFYTTVRLIPGLSPADVALHFRAKLTAPQTPGLQPLATNLVTFQQFAASGYDGTDGFVEWKVPLTAFPLESIVGRCVDAWVDAPPHPNRTDSTPSQEGVYLDVQQGAGGSPAMMELLLGK
jgi:hypothetical protein